MNYAVVIAEESGYFMGNIPKLFINAYDKPALFYALM